MIMSDLQQAEDSEVILIREDEVGKRLDVILAARYKDMKSRTYFHTLFEKGKILVDGQPVKKHYKPKEAGPVEIHFILPPQMDLMPENIPLKIIYEDEALIVIDKPSGMVVHPAPGNWTGTVVNALLYYCDALKKEFEQDHIRPGIVHRLDKETSGIIVAAKSSLAHQRLVEMFSSRQVYKEYIAVCVGNPGRGIIDAAIGRDPNHRKQMKVVDGGRNAITEFETLAADEKLSVVKIILKTGRTHQIRVHMQMRKTPVLGDSLYGATQANKKYNAKRQLLHARSIAFLHPLSKKPMSFQSDLPPDILEWTTKLGLDLNKLKI